MSSNSCIWNSWTSLRGSLSPRELMTPATSSSHWILHGLCFGFSPVSFFIVYQQRLWTNIIAGTPVINGLYLAQALVPCSSSSLWPWELNYSSAFSPKVTRIRTIKLVPGLVHQFQYPRSDVKPRGSCDSSAMFLLEREF